MNRYKLIYWINKVFPAWAERLAERYYPITTWETAHDLTDTEWANVNVDPGIVASGEYSDSIAPGEVVTLYDPCHCDDLELDVPRDIWPWDALGETEAAILAVDKKGTECPF